jgi:hypothetical protein
MARRTPASTSRPAPEGRPTRPTRQRSAAVTPEPSPPAVPEPAPVPVPDPPLAQAVRPDVIVDFHLEHGLLVVVLRNIGGASAYEVATTFDRPFRGLGGRTDISTLAMFRSVPFLAPGKQLSQLVDVVHAYFQRDEPTRLTARVTYADREGRRYADEIPHDLGLYRELAEAMPR